MREILFRGKRVDNGEWMYGYLLYDEISNVAAIVTYVNLSGNVCDLSEIGIYEVIPETVGQFTGLTDKNGQRIFEGDIIKTEWSSRKVIGVVKYNIDITAFVLDSGEHYLWFGDDIFCIYCDVIGNVHDNPELLTENAKEEN